MSPNLDACAAQVRLLVRVLDVALQLRSGSDREAPELVAVPPDSRLAPERCVVDLRPD